MKIPDYLEPLVGWRAWSNVNREGHLVPLVSVHQVWPKRIPAQAMCECCKQFAKPSMHNQIGFYAFKKVIDLLDETVVQNRFHNRYGNYVFGQVYMWGTLVECGQRVAEINNDTGYRNEVKGWRAEFAYPKRLMTENADLAAQLQDDYGVPCEVGRAIDIYNELLRRAQP